MISSTSSKVKGKVSPYIYINIQFKCIHEVVRSKSNPNWFHFRNEWSQRSRSNGSALPQPPVTHFAQENWSHIKETTEGKQFVKKSQSEQDIYIVIHPPRQSEEILGHYGNGQSGEIIRHSFFVFHF